MRLLNEINYFYYRMALYELQLMNETDYYNGLSYNSMLYINVIDQTKDCTVSKLAELLHVTKSAVTLKINELVKSGFVHKVQSTEDKRVFYVKLNENTLNALSIYDKHFIEIEKTLSKDFSKEQLDHFNEVLHAISGYEWR